MTYKIIIDGKTSQEIDDKAIAYANYRAVCRDYANKPKKVELVHHEALITNKAAHLQLLDDNDVFSANDVLKHMMQLQNLNIKSLKDKIKTSQLKLSNSRIDGWLRTTDDRHYTQMHNDELIAVLSILMSDTQAQIKSPANIVALRQKLGLTQSELAEKLGMASSHRQVARWEAGDAEMPDTKWQKMQNL
ncbi:helix-turn-helix domain-containing protein [Moraxella sp. ZJ142]|uniref:helix-turn-helix domain-containing protein n=1 Tax=Moraxella marmotae TaxID=3344520 RepID=UPI0035D512C7